MFGNGRCYFRSRRRKYYNNGGMVTSGVGVGIAVASDVFVGVGGTITSGVAVGAFDTISVLTSVSLDAEPQLLKTEMLNIIEIMHNSIL